MSGDTPPPLRAWAVRGAMLLAVLGAIAFVAAALQGAEAGDDGPRPVRWGEVPCAHCRMLVGEPRYAAQLVTRGGEALTFDDAGCLLRYVDERRPELAATYFHHAGEDRWLRAPQVAFVRVERTPMGYGLVAVDPGTSGAIGLAEARSAVLAAHHREAGP